MLSHHVDSDKNTSQKICFHLELSFVDSLCTSLNGKYQHAQFLIILGNKAAWYQLHLSFTAFKLTVDVVIQWNDGIQEQMSLFLKD